MTAARKPASNSDTPPITLIFLVAVGIGVITLCWPVFFVHGQTDTGGWRWDIHSTYACAAWWGAIGLFTLITWADRREAARIAAPPMKAASPGPRPRAVRPPACRHLHAVPVDLSTGERVAFWCEQCETQLDGSFGRWARSCCPSKPGNPHWHSCPEAKVTS